MVLNTRAHRTPPTSTGLCQRALQPQTRLHGPQTQPEGGASAEAKPLIWSLTIRGPGARPLTWAPRGCPSAGLETKTWPPETGHVHKSPARRRDTPRGTVDWTEAALSWEPRTTAHAEQPGLRPPPQFQQTLVLLEPPSCPKVRVDSECPWQAWTAHAPADTSCHNRLLTRGGGLQASRPFLQELPKASSYRKPSLTTQPPGSFKTEISEKQPCPPQHLASSKGHSAPAFVPILNAPRLALEPQLQGPGLLSRKAEL